jgi:hypothetical protein
MKIAIYWTWLHGGIEDIWRGRYYARCAIAVGRSHRGEPKEELSVQLGTDGRATISGGSVAGEQTGSWRRKGSGIEVELPAGS